MNILKNILDTTRIDGPYFLRNAVLYTLHDTCQTISDSPPRFITLEAGRQENSVTMKELPPFDIHSVEVRNKSDLSLFLLDGEICCAGYQDRIVVTSGLIGKHTAKIVPVACVERGRSTGPTSNFLPDSTLAFPSLRAEVASSLSRDGNTTQVTIHQEKIWAYVAKSLATLHIRSNTQSIHNLYEQKKTDIVRYAGSSSLKKGMRGYICSIGNGMALDIFDPGLFGMLHQKLIDSYVIESLLHSSEMTSPSEVSTIEKWLENIASVSPVHTYRGVDMGENISVQGDGIVGSGLILDRQIISFSLYDHVTAKNKGQVYN
jgi:hypothetical protein